MRNKYSARALMIGGERFDSKAEARRWRELKLMERAGEIRELKRQVKYELIPAQKDLDGRVLEKSVSYIADFKYIDLRSGECVVEDVKGVCTKEYVIKRKLMLWLKGIQIREVRM